MATKFNNGESGTSVRSKINEAIDELNAAQTDISALQTTVSSHTSSISSLSTTVSGHTTSISQLNTSLITQAGQISTLNSTVTSLSTTVSGHTTDISNINTYLAGKQNKNRDSTLTIDISEQSSDFSNPLDYISTLFLFEGTGGAGNVLTLTDSSTSGAPLAKPFFVYNTNASIDSLVITPDSGVTCEYAGSLTSTIAPGDFAGLIQVDLNIWVRFQ